MTYEIKIERLEDSPEAKYPTRIEIYSQRVDDLDVEAVIVAANKRIGSVVMELRP